MKEQGFALRLLAPKDYRPTYVLNVGEDDIRMDGRADGDSVITVDSTDRVLLELRASSDKSRKVRGFVLTSTTDMKSVHINIGENKQEDYVRAKARYDENRHVSWLELERVKSDLDIVVSYVNAKAAHLLNENEPSSKLKDLHAKYISENGKKGKSCEDFFKKVDFDEIPIADLVDEEALNLIPIGLEVPASIMPRIGKFRNLRSLEIQGDRKLTVMDVLSLDWKLSCTHITPNVPIVELILRICPLVDTNPSHERSYKDFDFDYSDVTCRISFQDFLTAYEVDLEGQCDYMANTSHLGGLATNLMETFGATMELELLRQLGAEFVRIASHQNKDELKQRLFTHTQLMQRLVDDVNELLSHMKSTQYSDYPYFGDKFVVTVA